MLPESLLAVFRDKGCVRMLAKRLSPNDNSKNQVYLGGDYSAIQLLPFGKLEMDSASISGSKRDRLKASIVIHWVDEAGNEFPAPNANLILYPKYPEVRLSGFLLGVQIQYPSSVMVPREEGRWIFMGVRPDGVLLTYACSAQSPCAKWAESELTKTPLSGVFHEYLIQRDVSDSIKQKLRLIAQKGWIRSKRLDGLGNTQPCESENCGGYTLEAELGITPNGRSDPDFAGWEVKQFNVADLTKPVGGQITLFTPEPDGGFYRERGVSDFLRAYGYPDKNGVEDRINFGGVHKVNTPHHLTNLTMSLDGWDSKKNVISSVSGGVVLKDTKGQPAASWSFESLINHWKRKHAKAVYIPSIRRTPPREYRYGSSVFAGIGADFSLVLKAFHDGTVVYDPGIKMENSSSKKPEIKRRSQFRVHFADLKQLYQESEWWNLA